MLFGGEHFELFSDTWELKVGQIGDSNCDDSVGVDDLLSIINSWGQCPVEGDCPADLTGNSIVDVDDLMLVIFNWT